MFVLVGAASCSDETGQSHTPTPTTDAGITDVFSDIGHDVIAEPTCDDGIQNGSETDIDCGGEDCAPCNDGAQCQAGVDCESGACQQGQCVPAACTDGIQNGAETDVDCGGEDCAPCQTGSSCGAPSDCVSGQCDEGVCYIAECSEMTCPDEEACYRGACYPACETAEHCEAGSRCFEGHCAPVSCNGLACAIGESCFQGVCYPACEGELPCPALHVVTEEVAELTAFSVTLVGAIIERPLDAPNDHGFCWGTEPEPDELSGECNSLGEVELPGPFQAEIEGLLPGQDYYVRAYATDGHDIVYANTISFQTLAPRPDGVVASAGDYLDYVEVSWQPLAGVNGYLVYRDGVEIAEVDAEQTTHHDEAANAASTPGEPTNLRASEGDYTDRVRVQWDVAGTADDAARHDYTVVARYPSVDSLASDESRGYRGAADIEHYEVQIDGGMWLELGDVLEYDDMEAPAATIDAGQAEAGEGLFEDRVPLSLSGAQTVAGAGAVYRVRAVSELGTGQETDEVSGFRSAGELSFQWERSSGDADSDYGDLPGATTSDWDDTTAPADGSARYYRVALSAEGAESVYSEATRGFRAVEAVVTTEMVSPIDQTTATFHGLLASLGIPSATEHGFCWGTAPAPSTAGSNGELCHEFGAPGDTGSFSLEADGLMAGTEYFVRAYVINAAGVRYGQDVSFVTLPTAVTGLVASDGAHQDRVTLSWDASQGATSYKVLRDGVIITTTEGTSFDDLEADASPAPTAPSITATQGDHTDRVSLTWTRPDAVDGATHTYTIIAVNETGDAPSSNSDGGYRGPHQVTSFELSIDAQGWLEVGNTTSHDDTGAPQGTISAGAAQASEGDYVDHVELQGSGASSTDGESASYRVRAINSTGTGEVSEQASGYRGVGALSYQWQRSASDSDDNYTNIAGATTQAFNDGDAPASGEGRYYRVVVSAEGAASSNSTANRGFRAALAGLVTHAATSVTAGGATLHGELVVLGAPSPTAHGFCWSTLPGPQLGDDCIDLGARANLGAFTHTVSGLASGTTYYVRAYATTNAGTSYGGQVTLLSIPSAPANLIASNGTSSEHVRLNWDAVQGATGYRVFRDNVLVDTTTQTTLDDTQASAPGVPSSSVITATNGTHTDRVALSWTVATVPNGASHTYHVVAINQTGASQASNTDSGYRAPRPVTNYELRFDDGVWFDAGLVTTYNDTSAPAATLTAGAAAASNGTSSAHVALSVSGVTTAAGQSVTYRVRALNATGTGAASSPDTGNRGIGALVYQWQRSAGDSDASYSHIPGATTASFNDTGAPADGSARYFRVLVSAEGAATYDSTADRGFRAALPGLVTNAATNVTGTAATLNANLTTLGAPNPTAHGFCWGTSPSPQLGGNCVNLGPRSVTGTFSHPQSGFANGTTYFVRAYATTNAGTAYGNQVSFVTIPPAPTGLVASNGTSSDHVRVTWNAAQGATGYRVFRDNVLINTLAQTTFDDTQAGVPGVPSTSVITATSGTHTDRVALSWTTATVPNGATHTYHVVAINGSGASAASNTDTGYRAARPVTSYELRFDGGVWFDAGLVTSFNDTGAPAPTVTAGTPSASQGTVVPHVALSLAGQSGNVGATVQYRVRALNLTGTGAASNPDGGYRGVGALGYQWQRSSADSNANYSNISGATTASFDDTGAPADGSGRYYRVIVSAQGAQSATTNGVRGFRGLFSSATFTTCGLTGRVGPTQTNCNAAYSGGPLADKVTVNGGIQTWTVPATGTYRFEAFGAQGGNSGDNVAGGLGARMRGDFALTAGQTVSIIVGQRPTGLPSGGSIVRSGGGGGGTFLVINGQPVLVAGGGGGNGTTSPSTIHASATTTANGGNGGMSIGSGGSGGAGGAGGSYCGGGAGWTSNGARNSNTTYFVEGGFRYLAGGLGGREWSNSTSDNRGTDGGFGGGGGGWAGGGGGGGYSGGGGGGWSPQGSGGGGASINTGTTQSNSGGVRSGPGLLTVTLVN